MASNLRAKPLEGHVTDSAGNVLSNKQIIIKLTTPSGSFPVDTVNSDDTGYFISKPLPNGWYEIYESGIAVARTIHMTDKFGIQSFKAHTDNYNLLTLENFNELANESPSRMNDYIAFLQIEPSEIDVNQYGSSFPIYNFDITTRPELGNDDSADELWFLSQFLNLNHDSRITTTRFDVEYFSPLTALSRNYRRVRWAGVPGIRYYADSKLVLPLDYYSIIPSFPRIITPKASDFGSFASGDYIEFVSDNESNDYVTIKNMGGSNNDFINAVNNSKIGDIVKLYVSHNSVYKGIWYAIISSIELTEEGESTYEVKLERLKSSRFVNGFDASLSNPEWYVTRMMVYDGMFQGIRDINEDANEKFSVVENIFAQNIGTQELYNYNQSYS